MGLKLMAEVGLDGAGIETGIKKLEGLAHGAAHGLKDLVMAGVGIYAVEQAIHKTIETAEELVHSSERLSIAPEQLQVLRQAAKAAGVEMDSLATAFEKIDIARQKALAGDKDARSAFGAAGITMDDLHSKSAAQLFTGPLANMAKGRNTEEIGQVFKELGMKGFGQLIPVLKTNFEELEGKMRKFGGIMDTETALKLKMLADHMSLLGQVITSQLGPAMVKLAEFIYAKILNVGRIVAGGAGAFNKATEGMGAADKFATFFLLPMQEFVHRFGKDKMGKTEAREAAVKDLGALGFKVNLGPEAAAAGRKAAEPWQAAIGQFEEFQKKFAEEAEKLRNPPAPDFTKSTVAKGLDKKALLNTGDSLTKVGNFLGGSESMLTKIAQQQVTLLQRIATNTGQKPQLSKPYVGDVNATQFPIC